MPQYIDCYFLIDNRNTDLVNTFLKKYLPINKESASEYSVPLFSDNPTNFFSDINDVLMYLEHDGNCEYSIYWHSIESNSVIKHAMVHYTDDGKMIFGISITGNDPMDYKIVPLFHEIKNSFKSHLGCITVEEPPPSNSIEFIEFAQNRYIPV